MRCPSCGELNAPGARFCVRCGSTLAAEPGTPQPGAPQQGQPQAVGTAPALAPVGMRVVARLIDLVLAGVLFGLLVLLFDSMIDDEGEFLAGLAQFLLAALVTTVAMIVHELAGTGGSGQTIGKRAVGIRVTRADGARAGIGRTLLRTGVLFVATWVPPWPILTLVVAGWAFFDANRQGLHDKAAGTVVVRA